MRELGGWDVVSTLAWYAGWGFLVCTVVYVGVVGVFILLEGG